MNGSRSITELKTYRDVVEKLVIPNITSSLFSDSPVEPADGTRNTFTATKDFRQSTLAVYVNGSRLHPDDYTVTGNRSILLKTTPTAGHKIVLDYAPMNV